MKAAPTYQNREVPAPAIRRRMVVGSPRARCLDLSPPRPAGFFINPPKMNRRDKLLCGLDVQNRIGIEIGALCNPILSEQEGEVIYVDYTDTATLRERYRNDPHVDIDKIVNVTAIWGDNTLSQALGGNRRVDFVVASHVIEHVPDLIAWLNELRPVLADGGEVRLAIPDKRFTFDYLREETRLSDVINAYVLKTRVPLPHEVLDFVLNKTTLDIVAAWNGEIDAAALKKEYTVESALSLAANALSGIYEDVHCWVFTPKSFATLMYNLARLGFVDWECNSFFDTERYTFEFFVSMRASSNRPAILDSWLRMANEASADPEDSEIARLRGEVSAQQQKNAELLTGIGQSQVRLNTVSEELAECRAQLAKCQTQLAASQADVKRTEATFMESTSWRITTPLRYMATLARKRRMPHKAE